MIWDRHWAEALLKVRTPPAADSLLGRALRLFIREPVVGVHREIAEAAWDALPLDRQVELSLDVAEVRQEKREEEAGDTSQTLINAQMDEVEAKAAAEREEEKRLARAKVGQR